MLLQSLKKQTVFFGSPTPRILALRTSVAAVRTHHAGRGLRRRFLLFEVIQLTVAGLAKGGWFAIGRHRVVVLVIIIVVIAIKKGHGRTSRGQKVVVVLLHGGVGNVGRIVGNGPDSSVFF